MTNNEHVCAICCRPETAIGVIYCQPVKTIKGYVLINFLTFSSSCFEDIKTKSFRDRRSRTSTIAYDAAVSHSKQAKVVPNPVKVER